MHNAARDEPLPAEANGAASLLKASLARITELEQALAEARAALLAREEDHLAVNEQLHSINEELTTVNEELANQNIELNRLNRSLRESESRFRAFGDSISQLAWAALPDGFIDWYNQQWYEYTGATPQQMEGWGWQSVHHPEVLPSVIEKWQASISVGQPFEMEFPLRAADGTFRTFLTRATPQRDAEGNVIRWFGTNTDIQSRIEAEAMLRRARDAAEEASRAKDQFLATLSHELRTPLTPVLLIAAAMEGDDALAPQVREDFGMIRKNIALEARIIDDLLDLTLISHGKLTLRMETVDPRPILEHTAALLRNEIAEKSLLVSLDFESSSARVSADPVRLQQVFWNILKNAVKFTPFNGTIAIRSSAKDHCLHVEFADSGLGILPGEMARIFEAFVQGREASSPRFGGLGLGLSISAIIVREHRGKLWAESPGAGKGATFHVELPLEGFPARPVARPAQPPGKARSLRILLVEDDTASRDTLSRLLVKRGHQVTSASCVAAAREMAGRAALDVLISDLGLPDGHGNELMRELQAKFGLPGIALSGYGMESDMLKSKESGFSEHLTKPVSLSELERALARTVSKIMV